MRCEKVRDSMYRRFGALFLCISLLLTNRTVLAGGQRWSAWLYDQKQAQLLLLTDTMGGTPQPLNLPIAAGFNTFSSNIAISHDWHFFTYLVSNDATNAKA